MYYRSQLTAPGNFVFEVVFSHTTITGQEVDDSRICRGIVLFRRNRPSYAAAGGIGGRGFLLRIR
jgi:hypothetical protein